FKHSFQTTDLISTAGYDNIVQHLNDGRKNCKEFEDFLRERASIEERYGKELMNLSRKKPCGQTELNTLRRALEVFKQRVETVGQIHMQLAQNLREEAKKMEDFREKQKFHRKKIELIMDAIHKNRNLQYKKTLELFVKLAQAKTALEDSDRLYQNNVNALEKIREEWQNEHVKACEFFESQECERINYFRNALWFHVNQLSEACVRNDDNYEEIRKALEQCSIGNDIECFVHIRKTGNIPPAPVVYENYYNTQRNTGPRRSQLPVPGTRPQMPIPSSEPGEANYATVDGYSLIHPH
ncbi:proline-serine-threonine phosphatase-interacting protein 2, partial [Protobothrops mucrosquamatus]|uniref:proline-serine-threonine phosphatase-interacting protein 2 n=1 Tax=Protobothrops mucrosquamatus TaxID=103944 RepID=UPI00077567E0